MTLSTLRPAAYQYIATMDGHPIASADTLVQTRAYLVWALMPHRHRLLWEAEWHACERVVEWREEPRV